VLNGFHEDNDIEIRPIIGGNITKQPFYKGEQGNYPNTDLIHENGFYIPNNPDLTDEEVIKICGLLK